jgi:amino acid adenylation domain-containing protein
MQNTSKPSVSGLSASQQALLDKKLRGALKERGPKASVILPRAASEAPPLSFAQQRLWFLEQLIPGTSVYSIFYPLRLRGPLDIPALERSLGEIVRRHEILRTTFPSKGGKPLQCIAPFVDFKLPVIDFESLPESARQAEARQLTAEEARRPLSLEHGPIFRASLIRLGPSEHILMLNFHHIASDGWSEGVFFGELSALYKAFAQNKPSPLKELAIQYADFACWQQQRGDDEEIANQLSYWKKHLAGNPARLDLPLERPRRTSTDCKGSLEQLTLDLQLTQDLKALSVAQKATPFMVLTAAFKALLHRYSGQVDILVGTPMAGRNPADTEPLIGFFVNTLVLRTDCSGNPTFLDLLGRVRQTLLDAHANQDVPFERLVQELDADRSENQTPFFDAMLSYQAASSSLSDWEHISIEPLAEHTDTAKFDLNLMITDAPKGLKLVLEYSANVFTPGRAQQLLAHYQRFLREIVEHPDRRIGELALMSPEEQHQILKQWNQTSADYPSEEPIHRLFEMQVERKPEAIAVEYGECRLTYGELNARANQLARHLQSLGVQRGTLVGVCKERSCDLIVTLLGILKAGGAYAPFDPSYPAERIALMIEDTKVPVIVADAALKNRFADREAAIVCIEADKTAIRTQKPENLQTTGSGGDLAYIIYTSGSTGRPKGILIPHRAVNRLVFNTNYIELGPTDVIAQASNASFDAATFEIWGALLRGGKLAGIDKDTALSPTELVMEIRRRNITAIFLTTALFNEVIRQNPAAFLGVKNLLFGGEAVDPYRVWECLEGGPPERLLHVYGPTEVTTFALWHEVKTGRKADKTVPIGLPISNTTAYVLDREGRLVPTGVQGELCLGGAGMACGYHERPELTAQKFIADPFHPGEKLYRTGDLVKRRQDGAIVFLGRIDHQVKIRGFRIELGEIEQILDEHPKIKDAVVVAREDTPGDKRLVAYFVAQNGNDPAPAELMEYLRIKLPDYMVPSAFVALEKLPLSPNGKVDRRMLPAPGAGALASAEFVAPRTPTEELVARVWTDVLRIKQVGVNDNFFDLGGHSLLATQVMSRINETTGVGLSLRVIFEHPTIASLSAAITQSQLTNTDPEELARLLAEFDEMPEQAGGGRLSE